MRSSANWITRADGFGPSEYAKAIAPRRRRRDHKQDERGARWYASRSGQWRVLQPAPDALEYEFFGTVGGEERAPLAREIDPVQIAHSVSSSGRTASPVAAECPTAKVAAM